RGWILIVEEAEAGDVDRRSAGVVELDPVGRAAGEDLVEDDGSGCRGRRRHPRRPEDCQERQHDEGQEKWTTDRGQQEAIPSRENQPEWFPGGKEGTGLCLTPINGKRRDVRESAWDADVAVPARSAGRAGGGSQARRVAAGHRALPLR